MSDSFESLSPDAALSAVEESHGFRLDATLNPYSSYVNRVYGVKREDGESLVVKFYRPGRWTEEAILEEHRFLLDCVEAEIPVVAPIPGLDGKTLYRARANQDGNARAAEGGDAGGNEGAAAGGDAAGNEGAAAGGDAAGNAGGNEGAASGIPFAVFPKMGGRNFEADGDEDLIRLGALLGRCHAAGIRRDAPHRLTCLPGTLTASFVEELLSQKLVHPKWAPDFARVCHETLELISPAFEGVALQRIHGDCHRGNIIDRPGTGLFLIDFDDMMMGPAVQDLWMILPGYAHDSGREIGLLLSGYQEFHGFDPESLRLIEPLRFMRIIYFLAWRARQRNDFWFRKSFPDWGTEAFWIKEIEDLRSQAEVIRKEQWK